ncbi:MAG: DinB family protein [Gemmatimonadetes bacterium]|jgi:uncharacterized damage-inducible protein DinB|nr:DinB family protein [Gemmatimonadota bacterium]
MSDATPGLALRELLDYTATENQRWHGWFSDHPSALDASYGNAPLATVRDVVRHVAFVERRYAAILAGYEVPAATGLATDDAARLFAYVDESRRQLESALLQAAEGGLQREVEFMTLTAGKQRASGRKIAAHALMHGIRHWAQLATVLRERGHPTDWPHDLLLSDALR